jgi:hypothetical protein
MYICILDQQEDGRDVPLLLEAYICVCRYIYMYMYICILDQQGDRRDMPLLSEAPSYEYIYTQIFTYIYVYICIHIYIIYPLTLTP